MPVEQMKRMISLSAAADLSAKRFCFVKLTANNSCNLCGAGEAAVGVLDNSPVSGEPAAVAVSGQVRVYAGATLTAEQKVCSDANGHAVPAGADDTNILGTVIEGCASGGMSAILLQPYYQQKGCQTYVAGEDLTAAQYKLVTVGAAAGKVIKANVAGEQCLGVLQNAPANEAAAQVQTFGRTTVLSGAAFALGDRLMADTTARAIKATTWGGERVFAVALADAAGAGEEVDVLVLPHEVFAADRTQMFIAGAGGATAKLLVVSDTTDGQVLVSGAGEPAIGVALNSALAAANVRVQLTGIATVTSGAAITAGDRLAADAAGKAVTFVGTPNYFCCGVALSSASGADEDVQILLGFQVRDAAALNQLVTTLAAGAGGTTEKHLVKADTTPGQVVTAGLAEAAFGVALATKLVGESVEVQFAGLATVVSGAGLSAGDLLYCDAAGRVLTWTGAASQYVIGVALSSAVGADEDVTALLGYSIIQTPVPAELQTAFATGAGGVTEKRFVAKNVTDDEVEDVAGAGASAVGVALTTEAAPDPVQVQFAGKVTCESGAAITAGDFIEADALGRAVPITGVAGRHVLGRAVTSVVGLGFDVEVMLGPQYPQTSETETRVYNDILVIDALNWVYQPDGSAFLTFNETNRRVLIRLPGLKDGQRINAFRVVGALGADAAKPTVVDAELRKVTKGAGAVVDALIDNIATVTVNADTALDAEETIGGGPEIVSTDFQYYILVTCTTFNDAACDVAIIGAELDFV